MGSFRHAGWRRLRVVVAVIVAAVVIVMDGDASIGVVRFVDKLPGLTVWFIVIGIRVIR